ncbi:MAG: 2-amino-4-hydroxy-6-hydroxymethyldihydropteridine diphosphokinase [Planctomycetaceae bacterium]|jgi:2-amino-4-hydroxy-6-hydroxymethyldihydropteridine diphosphokinase|nr:2-amino-4-hydroxy-6-hydroxymethyldihydropteridine diphosphokinase [Planctomycetaceae bacterium]
MINVLLAFGANLGNREETLRSAWKELETLPDTEAFQISTFYETKPVGGPPEQPDYVNAAGTIRTELPPVELLKHLQQIEYRFGRVRTERRGARTLDIDILLYGSEIINLPELTVPHSEMLHRNFVLRPVQDVAADWIHPVSGLTLSAHFAALFGKSTTS